MKKKIIIFVVILGVFSILIASYFTLFCKKFKIENCNDCTIIENFSGKISETPVDNEDAAKIASILNGRRMFSDNLSCGFPETPSVSFNNGETILCFASDGCSYLYSKNDNKYISFSSDELSEILLKYGISYPMTYQREKERSKKLQASVNITEKS